MCFSLDWKKAGRLECVVAGAWRRNNMTDCDIPPAGALHRYNGSGAMGTVNNKVINPLCAGWRDGRESKQQTSGSISAHLPSATPPGHIRESN